MKNVLTLILLLQISNASILEVVPYVSPQKFSGLWYEIARTQNSYQEECVASSVEYILEENEYEVYNRCFDKKIGADLIEYKGTAQAALTQGNMSSIDMTYFWIFTKRYKVFYLEENYKYALIADSELEQLWIMSRTPKIDEKQLENILALLEGNMDLKRLIYTPQDEQGRYK